MLYHEGNRTDTVVGYLRTDGRRTSELTVRPSGALYICPVGNVIDCGTGCRHGRWEAPAWGVGTALELIAKAYGSDFELAL